MERTIERTLPGWVYGCPEFLALEKARIFRRHWQLVGHVCEMPAPGDYLTLALADEQVLVIRGDDGIPRAMHNVCRHRAGRIADGPRGHCAARMVCPYHGWSYARDGRLAGVPARESFAGVDLSAERLAPIQLEAWHGFLFVRVDGDGPSVAEAFAPFESEARAYDLEGLVPNGEAGETRVPVNWKCVVDNDAEGYHVALGHPGLQRLYGATYQDRSFALGASRSSGEIARAPSVAWSERCYQALLDACEHLPAPLRRRWTYYGLFPNTSLELYPDSVAFMQTLPVDAGNCRIRYRRYSYPRAGRVQAAARWLNRRINDQVWREDLALVMRMAPGLRSSSYRGGPISALEPCLASFHATVRSLIPQARLRERPSGPLGAVPEPEALRRLA